MAAGLGERLEVYFRLLATWNQKINLTALPLADPSPETLDRLLVEPLVAASHVGRDVVRMLDIGSGGGSPAIPMALALTSVELGMVEAKTRKSVFLREAIRVLGMNKAEVFTARFEELIQRPEFPEAYGLVTVRAVRMEARLLLMARTFLKPGGSLFLFRSADTKAIEAAVAPLTWSATFPLTESTRSRLVILKKQDTTSIGR
jgi:16S rRNA (guanine527-N7)-methyltransferase